MLTGLQRLLCLTASRIGGDVSRSIQDRRDVFRRGFAQEGLFFLVWDVCCLGCVLSGSRDVFCLVQGCRDVTEAF